MGEWCQLVSNTGTGNAFPRVDLEQCAMGGALQKGLFNVKKLIRLPFQWNAAMGAAVVIDVDRVAVIYHNQIDAFAYETAGIVAGDLTGIAHRVHSSFFHGLLNRFCGG